MSAGLFTVLLGSVNPIVPNMNIRLQSWLGVQPAGASELSPRQQLAAAPSAIALVPGITMVDESPDGAYAYSFWVSSTGHGAIYSETSKANSYSVVGRNAGATDSSCTGNEESCASGVTALASGTQNYGLWANADANNRCAVFSKNNSSSYYSGFFRNVGGAPVLGAMGDAWIGGNLSVSGAKSGYVVDIALNDGTETLRQGDVVVITGYAPPALGDIPVAKVQRAGEANATAVMGVVDKLYEPCRGDKDIAAGEACGGFRDDVTEIKPGQYLAVVTLGLYKAIRVDASAGPIKAGDLLATSGSRGLAAKATPLSVGGTSFNVPGTVVGKALGNLDSGAGVIPVFVSLK